MAGSLSAKNPIKNIAAEPPTRVHMDADGIKVTEKLNPMRVNRKMVHPDGDVVTVSLATGWTIQKTAPGYGMNAFRNNPYGSQILVEKIADGFLPFDECPVAQGYIPKRDGDKPCEGKFSDEKCCPHIDRVMQKRREAHRKEQEGYRVAQQNSNDKLLDHLKLHLAGNPIPESSRGKGMK